MLIVTVLGSYDIQKKLNSKFSAKIFPITFDHEQINNWTGNDSALCIKMDQNGQMGQMGKNVCELGHL